MADDAASRRTPAAYDSARGEAQQSTGGIAFESGELHRLLVESVEDYAIFALDPQGYILSWNPGAERFKGYKAHEVLGKHFSIFYEEKLVAAAFPEYELREAARVGRFEDEGWRVRKDGTRFWANVVLTALHDTSGKLIGFAKVTRDLTARRETEGTLRASEERFRLIIQAVKDYAIFMLDPDGRVATWNEGAQRIKGYTASEIVGRHFSKFYTDEDLAANKPATELEAARNAGQYQEEGWRVRKDGSHFWASVLITALRNGSDELIGFAKITRDLTERRAAQQRAVEDARHMGLEEAARLAADVAQARAERLQHLTSGLSAAHTIPEIATVVFTDAFQAAGADAGALAMLDDATQRINVVGHLGYASLPAWTRNIAIDDEVPISATVRTNAPVICWTRAQRDEQFPRIADVLAPYGATVVLPLRVRDKTIGALAMHRLEGHLLTTGALEFMQEVARQVAYALERAQLYELEKVARTRADDANRAKSEFLAAMSHELRTPLNAIGGYAQLMEMGVHGPVTAEQLEDLQRIRRSQEHLLGIINDILNFARIEAGQISFTYGEVKMREVLQSVGAMIEPQAAAKGLQFRMKPCDDVVAWADEAKVEQILLNLLSNAVKFTPAGSVTLSCELHGARQVRIVVEDTGIGIPNDQLERMFEPFIQVGRSLTTTLDGTGLGLAISRDLARAMDGEITAESAVGIGSALALTLPVPVDAKRVTPLAMPPPIGEYS